MRAKWFGRLCVAVLIGFVGANSLADASGLGDPGDRESFVIASGIIAGCLTMTALAFGEVQLRNLFSVLARTKQRPETALVIVLICGGIACLIAAVCLQLLGGPDASVSAEPGRVSANLNVRPSIMIPVTTFVLLLIGAMLIGLGVWGGIPPGDQDVATNTKQPPPKDFIQ